MAIREIRSHFYPYCRYCNGIFLCKVLFNSVQFSFVNCPYCGHDSKLRDSKEDSGMISRIAAIIEKEEPLEKILDIVQKHKNGISGKQFVIMLNKWRYKEKVMCQLAYLGLIAKDYDGGFFYSITEKGRKVLEVCNS